MTRRDIKLLAAGLGAGGLAGFAIAAALLVPAAELPQPQPVQPTPESACIADDSATDCQGWIEWHLDDQGVVSVDR